MTYATSVDERYAGGYLSFAAGTNDAPGSLNSIARLSDWQYAYGSLDDLTYGVDVDSYSMGVLDTGIYKVTVLDYTWDYGNFD